MLPIQLLRIRIKNNGKNIAPVFCEYSDNNISELHLATKMIEEFEQALEKKEKKGVLAERISMLESEYGHYKLVRGLYTLLERRCIFTNMKNTTTGINNSGNKASKKFGTNVASITSTIQPFTIRRELFEESSQRGFALVDIEKTKIMEIVASRLGLSIQDMAEEMWSDMEDNMILSQICKITPEQLIAWYNLSLMQTLLFNCTKLEFSVYGGSNWKRVLRDVKRLGLMYNLQQQQQQKEHEQTNDVNSIRNMADCQVPLRNNTIIACSIDGPLSVFKLTDRYGTAIAKLLPSIVSAETWSIRAWIVRKTMSAGKKIYEFEMSNKESPLLLDPYRDQVKSNNHQRQDFPNYEASSTNVYFDSSVEEKFASKFEQSATGWKLTREPDPLITSDGKALIPDFMIEKYDKKIYLEIVGFWTKEYLENKIHKIKDVSMRYNNKIDFFIAINNDHYTAASSTDNRGKESNSKILSTFIDTTHLILYKNDDIPIRHILEYLKSIELEIVAKYASHNYNNLLMDLDHIITKGASNGVISIDEIARKYNIPVESTLRIIRSNQEKAKGKGYTNSNYIITDKYLILKSKAQELNLLLTDTSKFNDACLLLKKNDVPESCHVDLLAKLGFDIIWKGIDSSNATIQRKKS
jgi:predicted nuclease of restriction endonuclease-like RecB superfamily